MWLCGHTPQLGKSITLLCKEKATVWTSECTHLTFKDEIPFLRAELWEAGRGQLCSQRWGTSSPQFLTRQPFFFLLDYDLRPHESNPGLTASKKIGPQSYNCKEPTCANNLNTCERRLPNQAVANTVISASWDPGRRAQLCCPQTLEP